MSSVDEISSDCSDNEVLHDELACDVSNSCLSFECQYLVALLSVIDKYSLSYSCIVDFLNFSLSSVDTLLNNRGIGSYFKVVRPFQKGKHEKYRITPVYQLYVYTQIIFLFFQLLCTVHAFGHFTA